MIEGDIVSTQAERQSRIERIRALPELLEALVRPLSAAQLTTHFLDGEWTVAQNVHHLADSHTNSVIRLKLILTEERPPLKPYDQERWAELADGGYPEIEDSLSILRGLHRRWVRIFESLSESDWQRTGHHPEIGDITPEDLLDSYANHGEGHLDQIRRTLAAEKP